MMQQQAGAQQVVGRFAPSPTGRLHAGNIFAYLVAWIVARRAGGKILLRIEDLDPSRSRVEYSDQTMRDLALLGLDWDGDPLYQSARSAHYEEVFHYLETRAELFPCFCTRADLHAASAPHAGESLVYAGTCRRLSALERAKKEEELAHGGRKASWRIAVENKDIAFVDLFQGQQVFSLVHDCGDFVLRRADGTFAYQLAVVVDDAEQGVTSVVRGCDLLQSTAMQIYLQQLLDFGHPEYAHVPLFVTTEGRRIAKREQDAGLDALLEQYASTDAIVGHIAYLAGLIPNDEPIKPADLVAHANLDSLSNTREIAWS